MPLPTAIAALLATVAVTVATSAQTTPPRPQSVAEMRDRYRPVLIFVPSKNPAWEQQVHTLLAHRSELMERHIMLVPFVPRWAGIVDGKTTTFLPQEEPSLRKRFHVPPAGFTIILIGKDGGEKLRSSEPIPFETLRDAIDAMPMRQQELQNYHPIRRR